jgi:hypothetical protein
MSNSTNNPSEDDIRGIEQKRNLEKIAIINRWAMWKSPLEIAQETGISPKSVYKVLKQCQREVTEKGNKDTDHGKNDTQTSQTPSDE